MPNKYIIASTAAEIISKRTGIPLHELVDIMAEVPAADVVKVVRCKDCRWYGQCFRNIRSEGNKPDDYCSYAERT